MLAVRIGRLAEALVFGVDWTALWAHGKMLSPVLTAANPAC
jgi:hypothetical protein